MILKGLIGYINKEWLFMEKIILLITILILTGCGGEQSEN
ncbi:hypothetical protein IGI37_000211 [Enterococcus sp. AZ194]